MISITSNSPKQACYSDKTEISLLKDGRLAAGFYHIHWLTCVLIWWRDLFMHACYVHVRDWGESEWKLWFYSMVESMIYYRETTKWQQCVFGGHDGSKFDSQKKFSYWMRELFGLMWSLDFDHVGLANMNGSILRFAPYTTESLCWMWEKITERRQISPEVQMILSSIVRLCRVCEHYQPLKRAYDANTLIRSQQLRAVCR